MVSAGDVFGRLTTVSLINKSDEKYKGRLWLCACECGNEKVVPETYLVRGVTRSCGCLRSENSKAIHTKHGESKEKIYRVWRSMKQRCYNENTNGYEHYGGKGIYVCEEWLDSKAFFDWAYENGYHEGLSIDRIDPNGPYCPENCRWATSVEQNNHTSRNHMLTFDGKTMSMADWSRETGISYNAIKSRINKHGWSVERALTTP